MEDYVTWEHNNQKKEGFLEEYFGEMEEEQPDSILGMKDGNASSEDPMNMMEERSVWSMAFETQMEEAGFEPPELNFSSNHKSIRLTSVSEVGSLKKEFPRKAESTKNRNSMVGEEHINMSLQDDYPWMGQDEYESQNGQP